MNGQNGILWAAVCCFILAALLSLLAINSMLPGQGYSSSAGWGYGHVVALFIPAVVALVAGVWLLAARARRR
jgi:hypothetical protein